MIDPPYDAQKPVSLDVVPETRPLDHTMFEALDAYVAAKIPEVDIDRVLAEGGAVHAWGVFPDDAENAIEPDLQVALRDERIRNLALLAVGLSDPSIEAVTMIAKNSRSLEGLPERPA